MQGNKGRDLDLIIKMCIVFEIMKIDVACMQRKRKCDIPGKFSLLAASLCQQLFVVLFFLFQFIKV